MFLLKLISAVFLIGAVASDPNRNSKFFNGGFGTYSDDNGDGLYYRADLKFGDLERAVDQLSSSLDTAFSSLADTIEDRVETSLPVWMRRAENSELPGNVEGIDAISGSLGEGIDDGLKVHFNEDVDEDITPEGGEPDILGRPDDFDYDDNDDFFNHGLGFGFQPFRPFSNPIFPFRGSNRRNGFPSIQNRRQWWKGPNVCIDREEIDEGRNEEEGQEGGDARGVSMNNMFMFSFGQFEMTSCSETNNIYTCTTKTSRRGINKTVKVTYRCCHGYVKEASGCTKVELRDVKETLQSIGTTDFLSLTKAGEVDTSTLENITIFVPTNEAMQEYTADLEAENEFDNGLDGDRTLNEVYLRRRRSIPNKKDLVLSHMVEGIHYAGDLHDEQVMETMANSSLRINLYSTSPPAATVNCARIVVVNQHSASGVVHTIDKILKPVTQNLAEMIGSDSQFSILKKLVSKAGLLKKLQEPGQLTVFAPTDSAFLTLPEPLLESLMNGNGCLEAVVKNHILPNVICSAAVQGKARTINLLDDHLMLEKTEDNKIFVEEAQVVARDIMGTNGVMHIVDAPLIPTGAKPIIEVLETLNLTRFLDLLESGGLLEELTGLNDVTVFAPSNNAVEQFPPEVLEELMSNPEKLRDILNYHVVIPSLQANDVRNNHIASTRAEKPLRINIYNRSPLLNGFVGINGRRNVHLTAGCSRISRLDSRACGAVVHVVEQLLVVPRETVMDHLEADPDFSIFTKILKDTGYAANLTEEGPYTVLAPSDHVFRTLPEIEFRHILENAELQEELAAQHILKEHVCCSGINPNTWLFMDHKRTLGGSALHVRRTNNGRLMAGHARITHCSPPTQNGLVHSVNHLLVDVSPNRNNSNQDRRPLFSAPGLQVLFG